MPTTPSSHSCGISTTGMPRVRASKTDSKCESNCAPIIPLAKRSLPAGAQRKECNLRPHPDDESALQKTSGCVYLTYIHGGSSHEHRQGISVGKQPGRAAAETVSPEKQGSGDLPPRR